MVEVEGFNGYTYLDEDFRAYFYDYFGSTWETDILTSSGIDSVLTDLNMLTDGLALNLHESDFFTVASGIADTSTTTLYNVLDIWNSTQRTVYSNYLFGKIVNLIITSDPIFRLRKWFGIDAEKADVLWNLLNLYRNEQASLDNAYLEALKNHEDDLKVYTNEISLL